MTDAVAIDEAEAIILGQRGTITTDDMRDAVAAEHAKSQRFFATLAAELRRPSYGVLQRDFLEALLIRAEEAKLYLPEGR